jgi:hypothetical protein
MRTSAAWLVVLAASYGLAQQGGQYRIQEYSHNFGGGPVAGAIVSSAQFTVDPASIGLGPARQELFGARFSGEAGFSLSYRSSREVQQLRIDSDRATWRWDAEPSVGDYRVYRDTISTLSGLGYGDCLVSGVRQTIHLDPSVPATGSGYFYLVTAANRLRREGSKGRSSAGLVRGNPNPCP